MLIHGDCLTELSQVPDDSVDMVFADLPYGVTANKWDVVIPFEPLWEQLLRVGKPKAAFVFTATQPFATNLICSQRKLFRYDLIWDKVAPRGFLNANRCPLRQHEIVLLFARQQVNYNPQKWDAERITRRGLQKGSRCKNYGKHRDVQAKASTDRYPVSIVRQCVEMNHTSHPTQKPVALLEWLIKTYSNPGETILDPAMGSGTTGVACKTTGREFIGIEKDAQYFEVASKRIAEAAAA